MSKKLNTNQLITRYALTGGAIGLYFGFFFRPARQPSIFFALLLALLIMGVMTAIKAFREKPPVGQLLKSAVATFFKAGLFLIMLELRHPIYIMGGRAAVTVVMTIVGALTGLWYAYEQIKSARNQP